MEWKSKLAKTCVLWWTSVLQSSAKHNSNSGQALRLHFGSVILFLLIRYLNIKMKTHFGELNIPTSIADKNILMSSK